MSLTISYLSLFKEREIMTDRILIKTTNGKFQHRKPTRKQTMFLHYLSQGHSKRQSMLKAGYSLSSANVPKNILSKPTMQATMESMTDILARSGLTAEYAAVKLAELLEATKMVNGKEFPDYSVQLKAFDIWFDIMKAAEKVEKEIPKRRISIEEFITGDIEVDEAL